MFDALVLSGGTSRRMGRDKATLVVDGSTLLDRVLTATAGATTTVVVGPEVPTYRPVLFAREDPALGGPAAAVGAGLALVSGPVVVLVAADLPLLTTGAVTALAAEAPAVLVDDDGRDQWLCGAWPAGALRAAFTGDLHGARLGLLLNELRPNRLHLPGRPWTDLDTLDDLEQLR